MLLESQAVCMYSNCVCTCCLSQGGDSRLKKQPQSRNKETRYPFLVVVEGWSGKAVPSNLRIPLFSCFPVVIRWHVM